MSWVDDILGRHHEKKSKENTEILKFSRIVAPFEALDQDETLSTFYNEGLMCFLLGFPNASMMLMLSCLERTLKKKYHQVEKKEPELNLAGLLNWLESRQKDLEISTVDVPHGFRILRNYITHEYKVIEESDAIEGIKYVSKIMNELYPYEVIPIDHYCDVCEETTTHEVSTELLILGEGFVLYCENCPEEDSESTYSTHDVTDYL